MDVQENLVDRWRLTNVDWQDHSTVARLGFCDSPYGPAVLKIGKNDSMIPNEVAALRAFGPAVCPAIYEYSAADSAYLMEWIRGGKKLGDMYPSHEDEADAWFSVYEQTSQTPPSPEYPTLQHFARLFDQMLTPDLEPRLAGVLRSARDLQGILMEPEHRLLHGDMHHGNVLLDSAGRWRLIDPHGVVGNPYYEIGAFMRNPMSTFPHEPDLPRMLELRIEALSKRLELAPAKVAEYGFYGIAFSLVWDLEDGAAGLDPDLIALGELCLRVAGH